MKKLLANIRRLYYSALPNVGDVFQYDLLPLARYMTDYTIYTMITAVRYESFLWVFNIKCYIQFDEVVVYRSGVVMKQLNYADSWDVFRVSHLLVPPKQAAAIKLMYFV